ncbi:MAG: NUDIX hydrolase [Sulfolobales archaeon]
MYFTRVGIQKIYSKKIFSGKRFSVLIELFSRDNILVEKEVVDFGEAVAIVPLLEGGEIILIKQFRAPINKWIYEIPAGKIDDGEDLYEAARRELIEETGYSPKKLKKILSIYTAPGYSNEVLHIFIAQDLVYVGERPEPGELINTEIIDLNAAINKVLSQEVVDAKTLIGLLMARDYLRENR